MASTFLRPLGFGEILDGAFTLYRRHFAVLFVSALLGSVPLTLASSALTANVQGPTPDPGALVLLFLALPFLLGGSMLLSAVLTRQIAGAVTGGTLTVADGYRRALVRLPQLAGAYLLFLLAGGAVGFVLAIAGGFFVAGAAFVAGSSGALAPGGGAAPLLVVVLIAVFAGVIGVAMLGVMTVFFAMVPAVIVEGQGPAAALGRSWRLARGAYLRIAGVLVIAWIILALPSLGLAAAAGVGAGSFLSPYTESGTLTTTAYAGQQVLTILTSALTWPFYVGCVTLLYLDRRVRTEGLDLEAAADALPARG